MRRIKRRPFQTILACLGILSSVARGADVTGKWFGVFHVVTLNGGKRDDKAVLILKQQGDENAIDRTHRRVVLQAHLFQFPNNRLSATEQTSVVQVESCQFHGFHHFDRTAPGVSMRTSGSVLWPGDLRVRHSRALDPFVDPTSAIAQRIGDARHRFSLPKTFQGPNPILPLRLFHRWLLLGNAIDAEPKLGLSRMLCQQIVHDVVAHLPVHDVAALVT